MNLNKEVNQNEIKTYTKKNFVTEDGREWFCVLNGEYPIGEVKVIYNEDNNKFIYTGYWKGKLLTGKKHGYGELEKLNFWSFNGIFDDGKINKGKFENHGNTYIGKFSYPNSDKFYLSEGRIKFKNGDIFEGKFNFNENFEEQLVIGTRTGFRKIAKKLLTNVNVNQFRLNDIREWKVTEKGKFEKHGSSNKVFLKEGIIECKLKNNLNVYENEIINFKTNQALFKDDMKLENGELTCITKNLEKKHIFNEGKIIKVIEKIISGSEKNSYFEYEDDIETINEWNNNKIMKKDYKISSVKKGTLEINSIFSDNCNALAKSRRIMKIKGSFDQKFNFNMPIESCIQGEIEFSHRKLIYKGMIENYNFVRGERIIPVKEDHSEKIILKGNFKNVFTFTEGKITYSDGSYFTGKFTPVEVNRNQITSDAFQLKTNYYYLRYEDKFLYNQKLIYKENKNKNKYITCNYKMKRYSLLNLYNVNGIFKIKDNVIIRHNGWRNDLRTLMLRNYNLPKKKITLYKHKRTKKQKNLKILEVIGSWKNNILIKGKIIYKIDYYKYSIMFQRDSEPYFRNLVLENDNETEKIKNVVNEIFNKEIKEENSNSNIGLKRKFALNL